jgi:hypothetical protein
MTPSVRTRLKVEERIQIMQLRAVVNRLRATTSDQWPQYAAILFFAIVILTALAVTILGYLFHWDWTGVTEKKFWNWLELLIAPVVLSAGGFLLYRAWAWSDNRLAEKRTQEATRDATLDQIAQKYLDSIQELMIEREAPEEEQERHHKERLSAVARARTLTVLEALDSKRKAYIIRFLGNAWLIMEEPPKEIAAPPFFIRLKGANLREVYLPRATLQGASFAGAHLEKANLEEANFAGANLEEANLWEAKLTSADLSNANLKGVKVTDEQLVQAKSLEGATMPDGQTLKSDDKPDGTTFEEWHKSKSRGEDGENSGPS